MADTQLQPKRPRGFGFINPEPYVLETGQIFVMSNFQVMPEPGGWNAQDEGWKHDMMVYLAGHQYYLWKAMGERQTPEADPNGFKMEYEMNDWTKYT